MIIHSISTDFILDFILRYHLFAVKVIKRVCRESNDFCGEIVIRNTQFNGRGAFPGDKVGGILRNERHFLGFDLSCGVIAREKLDFNGIAFNFFSEINPQTAAADSPAFIKIGFALRIEEGFGIAVKHIFCLTATELVVKLTEKCVPCGFDLRNCSLT